ncbi:MAG: hypothetical protein PHF61_09985, partial [Bacteroidales bacterium]|nr:hypothetical protein [Bacteroidales bacterium]
FEVEVKQLTEKIEELTIALEAAKRDRDIAAKSALDLQDESTEKLEANINNIETINVKVRANLDKDKAEQDAQDYADQYNTLTAELNNVRQAKIDLLKGANLPLPGLSVEDGELTYNGKKWDCMSGSEQLKVSTAIVRKLNPKCGFVLLDKLEQMDLDTLQEFGQWLEQEGLQAIATRVSTGPECEIIIEDGHVAGAEQPVQEAPKWKAGEF